MDECLDGWIIIRRGEASWLLLLLRRARIVLAIKAPWPPGWLPGLLRRGASRGAVVVVAAKREPFGGGRSERKGGHFLLSEAAQGLSDSVMTKE